MRKDYDLILEAGISSLSDTLSEKDKEFWDRFMREKSVNDIQNIKDAAKQLVTITSALQVLLLGLLPLKDIRPLISGWQALLLLFPSLPWLISLSLSVAVLIPVMKNANRNDLEKVKNVFEESARQKVRLLRAAQVLLLVGLGSLAIATAVYFLYVPLPPPKS